MLSQIVAAYARFNLVAASEPATWHQVSENSENVVGRLHSISTSFSAQTETLLKALTAAMRRSSLLALLPYLDFCLGACYYPNGDQADASSCYPHSEVSYCCPVGFDCSVSKVCVSQDQQTFLRGSCTDLSWRDVACPGFCLVGCELSLTPLKLSILIPTRYIGSSS